MSYCLLPATNEIKSLVRTFQTVSRVLLVITPCPRTYTKFAHRFRRTLQRALFVASKQLLSLKISHKLNNLFHSINYNRHFVSLFLSYLRTLRIHLFFYSRRLFWDVILISISNVNIKYINLPRKKWHANIARDFKI